MGRKRVGGRARVCMSLGPIESPLASVRAKMALDLPMTNPSFSTSARITSLVAATVLFVVTGCGGGGSGNDSAAADLGGRDPAILLNDKDVSGTERAAAARALWADAQGKDAATINAAREELKKMVWRGGAPQTAREAALECLFADTRPEGIADTANMLRLRLPTEPNYGVLKLACQGIADRASDPAWRATTMGLVRSWARKLPSPPDAQRPERTALVSLYPERSVEETVFTVFVEPKSFGAKPESEASAAAPDSVRRLRQNAWDLLGRLDPRGERRAALLNGQINTRDDAGLQTLVIAARELRVVPLTGSELEWVQDLRTSKEPMDSAWWKEVARLSAALTSEQAAGLQTRHLEPLRWSAANSPQWLGLDRAGLLSVFEQRLAGRRTHRVGESNGTDFAINANRVSDWREQLVWGDVLAMLVIDECVRDAAVRGELFRQSESDRTDPSTEWGGCLFDRTQRPGGAASGVSGFTAVTYPARPAQRINDRTFVASDEMFSLGGRSLAHYHFHAQTHTNHAYAGPGAGDRDYADLHNRNCVVFTPVRKGVMNADYYQRGGATIDLGEIVEEAAPAGR